MNEEKQIEEMARIIDDNHGFIVSSVETAEALYNADYRKQKEWISVEERLPEVGDDYLIVLKEKYEWEKEWRYHVDVATFITKWVCIFNDWDEGQEIHITHWMPLPEPPKMKG